jgi:transketolase
MNSSNAGKNRVLPSNSIESFSDHARSIRRSIVKMIAAAKASHIGGALSVTDLLTVLYFGIMRIDPKRPRWDDRDRLIFSKGHAAAALYAALAERGYVPKEMLQSYYGDGSKLAGHPTLDCIPGVECSTGSLGHGLAVGIGMAVAAKSDNRASRTFVILSDGECDEGSTWEAALLAPQLQLDNLVAIVDYNRLQGFGKTESVVNLEPFADKWRSFGWHVKEINGHDLKEIHQVFSGVPFQAGKPNAVIAHTIKGKGISFMEDSFEWHYRYPNEEQLKAALSELGE